MNLEELEKANKESNDEESVTVVNGKEGGELNHEDGPPYATPENDEHNEEAPQLMWQQKLMTAIRTKSFSRLNVLHIQLWKTKKRPKNAIDLHHP